LGDRSAAVRGYFSGGVLTLSLALSACATAPAPRSAALQSRAIFQTAELAPGNADGAVGQFHLNGALPWAQAAGSTLLDGGAGVNDLLGVFDARSSVRIEAGEVIDPDQWAGWSAQGRLPRSVGEQRAEQRLSASLDQFPGSPMQLSFSQRDESRWLLTQTADVQRRQAALDWSPASTQLHLSWADTRSEAAPALLDCAVEGSVSLPSVGALSALRLRARSCNVFSARMPAIRDAETWSAAATLAAASGAQTRFSLRAIDPTIDLVQSPLSGSDDPSAAYEIGVAQVLSLADWKARSAVALRSSSATDERARRQQWSADASVQRRLQQIDITAKLRNGVGDDWFLPGGAARARALAVDMDFSRWATQRLAWDDVAVSLTWQWTQQEVVAARDVEDLGVRGRIRVLW
jgi:hypothetical protein